MRPLYRLPTRRSGFKRDFLLCLLPCSLYALLVIWAAGQDFAEGVGFHPALGRPLGLTLPSVPDSRLLVLGLVPLAAVVVAALLGFLPRLSLLVVFAIPLGLVLDTGGPLYPPLELLVWRRRFATIPALAAALEPYWNVSVAFAIASPVASLVFALLQNPKAVDPDVHGSARFAGRRDLARAGLLHRAEETIVGPPGLFLGCWSDGRHRFSLYDPHDVHVFAFAPTRTGKGVGLVIPNLLLWEGSVLIVDIKSELFALTSGYRSAELGNHCFRFDPTVPGSSRYNPLFEVRLGPNEVRDAQNIADVLVDPNGDRPRDHWDRTAHDLLTAVILHVLYADAEKTLRGCASLLSRPGTNVADTLGLMIRHRHLPSGPHPIVASIAQAVLDKSADERSGVISTALSFLALYRDPLIAANTEVSDFRIADLMHQERPVSLYLTLPPSDLSRTRPLVRLLLNQIFRRLTEPPLTFSDGRPVPHYRHQLLVMMDELPALGRLSFLSESLAYLAGYGVRCFLVAQDLSQLQGAYGPKESITSNAHHRIAFAPNRPETAELVSQMAGTMTVHQDRRSRRAGGPLFASGTTLTPTESQRRLLTPDEAMRLPAGEALLFSSGLPVARSLKAPYYLDPELKRRASIPPPASLSSLVGEPSS